MSIAERGDGRRADGADAALVGSGMTYRQTPDGAIVTMWGEIDIMLRDIEAEVMAGLESHTDNTDITVDASDVTFIDSSGVAFFLKLYLYGQRAQTRVVLRNPSGPVVELLDMVGMAKVFPIFTVPRD
jgi:anti-anti-sigma factor